MCPEPAHPHGVVGYTLADPGRTRNALRLARWAVLALAIVAAAVVALALFSPLAAAGLLAGGSTATGGAMAIRRRRRRTPRNR
jgi:Flp pilus assembly protein TadB